MIGRLNGTRPARPGDDTNELLKRIAAIAQAQQLGIAHLERESIRVTTQALQELIPQVRAAAASGTVDRAPAQEALALVDSNLALLRCLAEARQRVVGVLTGLGQTSGISLNLTV
ncbi:MAG: hypothetical protein ACYDAB_07955 [bacterium]